MVQLTQNNLKFYYLKILNFLIFLFPCTFIVGNAAINLAVLFICVIGILLYKKDIINIEKNFVLISIIAFFLFLILSTLIDFYQNSENTNITRSFIYLRYLVLLLVLNCMVKNNQFNFRNFIFSCLFFSSIVALSVLFEGITGKHILERESHPHHNPGIFGEELIAGGYIQRFAILGIFSIPLIFLSDKKKLIFVFSLALSIFSAAIIFSGNRTPFILFLMFLCLGVLLAKQIRTAFFGGLILSLLIFTVITSTQKNYSLYWGSFYTNIVRSVLPGSKWFILDEVKKDYSEVKKQMSEDSAKINSEDEKFNYSYWKKRNWEGIKIIPFGTGHRIVWTTAIETWLEKPFIGNGIKSFREKCKGRLSIPNRVCQSHTHNFYLEILNDSGIIGAFFILFSIYFLCIKKFVQHIKSSKKKLIDESIFFPIFFILVLEFFPLRSSGNFFSTYNSAFIFFILGLLINYNFKKN